eukprot:TRINITY_DN1312_c0_g1_i1.p1 TRINITY_DN1312_c0_g1~~TRINITY_DN1312_c0_g1_i1.p1  ORF type:complete len:1707 (+),score=610.26 TRINITY_DN1312_c0_g1_i1:90-5210(+)
MDGDYDSEEGGIESPRSSDASIVLSDGEDVQLRREGEERWEAERRRRKELRNLRKEDVQPKVSDREGLESSSPRSLSSVGSNILSSSEAISVDHESSSDDSHPDSEGEVGESESIVSDSEGSMSGSTDDEADLTPEQRFELEQSRHKQTREKMKQLVSHFGDYKRFLESEKQSIEDRLAQMEVQHQEDRTQIDSLLQAASDSSSQIEMLLQAAMESDAKLKQLQEDRDAGKKENFDNLNTLFKELTIIESSNEELNIQVEKLQVEKNELQDELDMSRKLIEQLELKVTRQQKENADLSSRTSSVEDGSITSIVNSRQLQVEREKMEKVGRLLNEIRGIIQPAVSSDESDVVQRLEAEQSAHHSTKLQLEEAKRLQLDDAKNIEQMKKRIKDLLQTQSLAFGEKVGKEKEVTIVAPTSVPTRVSGEISPRSRSGSLSESKAGDKSKKKPEEPTMEERLTSLQKFIEAGQNDEVMKIIKKSRAVVMSTDSQGKVPLHWACHYGRAQIAKYLLDHGADPNFQDTNGWNSVHYAAKSPYNNVDVMKLLLKYPNLDIHTPNGDHNLPLHYLARTKFFSSEVFISYINKRAALDFQNFNGETALHNTCFEEGHEEAARLLIHYRANVNITTARGESPLHWAARMGLRKMVQILLDAKADPFIRGKDGTPLDIVPPGFPEITQLLEKAMNKKRRKREKSEAKFAQLESDKQGTPLENKLTLLVRNPTQEEMVALTTTIQPDWTIQRVFETIRKKFPGETSEYSLWLGQLKLDITKKVEDYPELYDRQEIMFSKEQPLLTLTKSGSQSTKKSKSKQMPQKNRESVLLRSLSMLPRSFSAFGQQDLPTAMPAKPAHPSAASSVSVKEVFKTLTSINKLDDYFKENPVKLAKLQALVRGRIVRKKYKTLLFNEKQREINVKQMLVIETAYAEALNGFYSQFLLKIKSKSVGASVHEATQDMIDQLEKLRTDCIKFTYALQDRASSWKINSKLADVLRMMIPILPHYRKYAELYYSSAAVFKQRDVLTTLIKSSGLTDVNANQIMMWAREPVQHLPSLMKSLMDFRNYTDRTHDDQRAIGDIIDQIQNVIDQIDSIHGQVENQEKLTQIQKSLSGLLQPIALPDRFYIREGKLYQRIDRNSKKRMIFLFSDAIIIADYARSPPYKFLEMEPISAATRVSEIPTDKKTKTFPFTMTTANANLIFEAVSQDETTSWIRILNSVIEDMKDNMRGRNRKSVALDFSVVAKILSPSFIQAQVSQAQQNIAKVPSKERDVKEVEKVMSPPAKTTPVEKPKKLRSSAESCCVCSSNFSISKRKYICLRCKNFVCRACSIKSGSNRLCMTCKNSPNSAANWVDLPAEILFRICEYIDIYQLGKIFRTCKAWENHGKNGNFWKNSYLSFWKRWPTGTTDWKHRYFLDHNWASGKYIQTTLSGHTGSVTCVKFNQSNILASGSIDASVRIWRMESENPPSSPGNSSQRILKHNQSVKALDFYGKSKLLTACESTVKIWDIETGKMVNSRKIHQGEITCLQYDAEKEVMYTGAADKMVKVTDLKTFKTTSNFAHKDPVTALQSCRGLTGKVELMTSCGNSLKLWDLKAGKCTNSFEGHTDIVRCVATDGSIFISGSDDQSLKVWTLSNRSIPLLGHAGKVTCLQFDAVKVVSGSTDETIKIWNLGGKSCVSTLAPDAGRIRCLQFDDTRLVSGHSDNSVRIWNFSPSS